jgi:hypothetical protein
VIAADAAAIARGVVVWSHARQHVRTFRPQAWVVLQDLALDAEWIDGRWVAPSSARLIADHLRIDAGIAAAALGQLREGGVAELTEASGSAGRFGLASYTLRLPSGVDVVSPCLARPHDPTPPGPIDRLGAHRRACSRDARRNDRAPSTRPPRRLEIELGL